MMNVLHAKTIFQLIDKIFVAVFMTRNNHNMLLRVIRIMKHTEKKKFGNYITKQVVIINFREFCVSRIVRWLWFFEIRFFMQSFDVDFHFMSVNSSTVTTRSTSKTSPQFTGNLWCFLSSSSLVVESSAASHVYN